MEPNSFRSPFCALIPVIREVADEVVRRVRQEFNTGIGRLPYNRRHRNTSELPSDYSRRSYLIALPREGYVQSVAYGSVVAWAEQRAAIVTLDFRPGDLMVEGDHKLAIYPVAADPGQARKQIGRFIVSGDQRTPTQDLEFAQRNLVEAAVRALSPGHQRSFHRSCRY